MSVEEINIAIAEGCGWKKLSTGKFLGFWVCPTTGTLFVPSAMPDFYHDLNAMHEAEKAISAKAREYIEQIDNVVGGYNQLFNLCFATAPQRAEAFLRTIGKWRDS